MFCQPDSLRWCIRTEDIRKALDELPETLDETYDRTLERIHEKRWKYAHIFFQCVAVASRPFSVEELAQFLAFDFDAGSMPTFQADWREEDPAHTVKSICPSLLTVVQPEGYSSPIVQFAHFSVQEYLMSARLSEAKDTISRFYVSTTSAHTVVAQACLGLLLHLDETVAEDSLEKFPLAEYVAKYWVGHARIEDVSPKMQNGMMRLFDPDKSHLFDWVLIYDLLYDGPPGNRPERPEHPEKPRATILHYAAFCGQHDIAKFAILKHSDDVNARDFNNNDTLLHVASRRGHADIVHLLLEHGVDVDAQNVYKATPLHLASSRGHADIARLLLEHGADVDAQNAYKATPLHLASSRGHADITRLLLEHGAELDAQADYEATPLHLASSRGHADIARLLIEYGAKDMS